MKYKVYKKTLKILKINQKISFFLTLICLSVIFFNFNVVAFAKQGVPYADDIYTIAEDNGIAKAICDAIEIGKILMIPLFAIMFSIMGLSAYQGKVKWTTFVTFALGMAAFKAAGSVAEFFMPAMGLQYGCKCAIERQIRDEDGNVKRYATNLNYDCSQGTDDYEAEYGLDESLITKENTTSTSTNTQNTETNGTNNTDNSTGG